MRLSAAIGGAARGVASWLRRGGRGAVGMELGIIAVPFFVVFLGVMEVSYDLYVQAELDNAVDLSARGVQVGSSQGSIGMTEKQFLQKAVCNNLGGLLTCDPNVLIVGVACVPAGKDYYSAPISTLINVNSSSNGGQLKTGGPGQMMAIEAWYEGPTFVGLLVPSFTKYWGARLVHETTSTAGWVNEYFPGGGGGC
jgi:Flp pilus assembly protein TadG